MAVALRRARGALGLGAPGGCSTKPVACHTSRAAWSRTRVVKPRRISGGTAGGTGKLKSPKVFSSQKGLGKKNLQSVQCWMMLEKRNGFLSASFQMEITHLIYIFDIMEIVEVRHRCRCCPSRQESSPPATPSSDADHVCN